MFNKAFLGLGTLKGDYQIRLKSDDKPLAILVSLYCNKCSNTILHGKVKKVVTYGGAWSDIDIRHSSIKLFTDDIALYKDHNPLCS